MDIITKDTGIIDAVQQHPEILEVFAKYGLGCVGAWQLITKPSAREQALTALMLKRLSPTSTRLLLLQNDLLNKNSLTFKRQTVFYYHLYNDLNKAISTLYPGNSFGVSK